jgi:hypothetical protein
MRHCYVVRRRKTLKSTLSEAAMADITAEIERVIRLYPDR